MSDGTWSVLDLGCDDETRQAIGGLSSLTSLYEIVKLAYITKDDDQKQTQQPNIVTNASWGLVCIALDSSLLVFDENCSSLKLQLTFEHKIDTILWVCSSEYLIVGDRGGKLHFIDVNNHAKLMSKTICNTASDLENPLFVGSACHPMVDGSTGMVFLTREGSFLRLGNLNIERLQEGIANGSAEELIEVQSNMTLDKISLKSDSIVTSCGFLLGAQENDVWMWFSNLDGDLFHFSLAFKEKPDDDEASAIELLSFSDDGFKKIVPIGCGSFVLALTSSNQLMVICNITLQSFIYEDCLSVKDFIFLPWTDDGTKHDKLQLLILCESCIDGKKSMFLRIVSIPELDCEYEIEVSYDSQLVPLGEGAESMVFLDPDSEEKYGIKIKNIVDGQPDSKLRKLICKGKFDEAEKFANYFKLDVELVHKGRARYLANLLNPFRSATNMTVSVIESPVEGTLDDLLTCLDQIKDILFVTSLCIDSTLPDVATILTSLNYAKNRLSASTKEMDSECVTTLSQRVSSELYRMKTLTILYPQNEITIEQWLSFSSTDMLQLYKKMLGNGELSISSNIWQRHQHEFQSVIDCKCVEEILNLIPVNLNSNQLIHWLPHNLSDLLRLCTAAIDVIAKWTMVRVRLLENAEKQLWPANGIEVINIVLNVLESVVVECNEVGDIELQMCQWKAYMSPSSSLHKLRLIFSALKDLEILATRYRKRMLLKDYMQSDVSAVVFLLLDLLVCGTEVAPLVKGFIIPVLLKQRPSGATIDSILAEYVEVTLSTDNNGWWGWEEAHWEDKLYAVIAIIKDERVKVSCILSCVKVAGVPWSAATTDICSKGIQMAECSGGVEKTSLLEQRRLVGLKIILRKYSVHITNFTDIQIPKFVLRKLAMSSLENVMADMLKVVSTFDQLNITYAYSLRSYHLLEKGEVEFVQSLLDNVPQCDVSETLFSIMNHCVQSLSLRTIIKSSIPVRKNIMRGVLSLEQYFLDDNLHEALFRGHIDSIRVLFSLQEKFSINLSLHSLRDPKKCDSVLFEQAEKWYEAKVTENWNEKSLTVKTKENVLRDITNEKNINNHLESDKENVPPKVKYEEDVNATLQFVDGLDHLYEMARLLGKNRQHLLNHLSQHAIEKKNVMAALTFIRLISEGFSDNGDGCDLMAGVLRLIMKLFESEWCPDTSSVFETDVQREKNLLSDTVQLILLAQNIATNLLVNSSVESLSWLRLVSDWLKTAEELYSLSHQEIVVTKTKKDDMKSYFMNTIFNTNFVDSGMPIDADMVTSMLKEAFTFCITKLSDPNNVCDGPLRKSLCDLAMHTATRNCLLISNSLRGEADRLNDENDTIINDSAKLFPLLFKIVNPNKTDVKLSISILTSLNLKKSLSVLNELIIKFGYDYPRLLEVSEIGMDLCSLNKKPEIKLQFAELAKSARWGKKLSEYNISFKECFLKPQTSLPKLFEPIASHPKCSRSLLIDYCNDFNLSVTEAMLCYLKCCLQSFNPEPQKSDTSDNWNIPTIPAALVSKMQGIIRQIPNRSLLHSSLITQLGNTSTYNYDVIQFILEQLLVLKDENSDEKMWQRALDILQFMKTYERKGSPNTAEQGEWIGRNPDSTTLPSIAHRRLPFHELFDEEMKLRNVMKIIESELDVQTVELWLSIAESLKLNPDQMRFIAVQNTVSRTLDKVVVNHGGGWELSHNHIGLLNAISSVILKIQHEKLAVACAKKVVNKFPPSIDKVHACANCVLLAQRWATSSPSTESRDAANNINENYNQLAIEHALHKHNLAEPRYMKMVNEPVQLVVALYEHPKLTAVNSLTSQNTPKVNECVTEICEKVKCNKEVILRDLLEKWLPPPECGSVNADDDITVSNFQLSALISDGGVNTTEGVQADLSRVIYLLRGCDQDFVIHYLLGCVNECHSVINSQFKLRALKCLIAVSDPQQLASYVTMEHLRSLLKKLSFVCRLESLGCISDPSLFDEMDKESLAEGLWRSHRHNPKALLLITDVCLEYQICKTALWNTVLTALSLHINTEETSLRSLMLRLRQHPSLWLLPGFSKAWQALVMAPFNRARAPLTPSCVDGVIEGVGLMAQCPVTLECVSVTLSLCDSMALSGLSMVIIGATSGDSSALGAIYNSSPKEELLQQLRKIKSKIPLPRLVENLLFSENLQV